MSRSINQSDEALNDVIQVAYYLAEQSGMNASDRFIAATRQAFTQIADMPGIGVLRDYDNPRYVGMRIWAIPGFQKYLLFYMTEDDEIKILRVLHGARNLDQIFAPEDTDE